MELQSFEAIDVEVVGDAAIESESIHESIRWYTAAEALSYTDLNKPAFQRAVKQLTDSYGFNKAALRRGEARATEYSELALKAVVLLAAKKFSELKKLAEKSSIPESSHTAIVFVDQHNQIATAAAGVADTNLAAIFSLKSELLGAYRQAGRAWGKQAGAELQLGFTEEVAKAVEKLSES